MKEVDNAQRTLLTFSISPSMTPYIQLVDRKGSRGPVKNSGSGYRTKMPSLQRPHSACTAFGFLQCQRVDCPPSNLGAVVQYDPRARRPASIVYGLLGIYICSGVHVQMTGGDDRNSIRLRFRCITGTGEQSTQGGQSKS